MMASRNITSVSKCFFTVKVTEHMSRFPRKVVESQLFGSQKFFTLLVVQTQLGIALKNLLYLTLL